MNHEATATVYCLRIELLDSEPSIWRQFCVNAQLSLHQLHPILAVVMGWSGKFSFRFKNSPKGTNGSPVTPPFSPATPLTQVLLRPGDSLLYTYNPEQGWLHKVWLETTIDPPNTHMPLPHCHAGERGCPPETCGGMWGYEELIDRLSDPDDPEYEQLWETVGGDFDPDWFDLKTTNQRLISLRL
jgi:hypothetical protein